MDITDNTKLRQSFDAMANLYDAEKRARQAAERQLAAVTRERDELAARCARLVSEIHAEVAKAIVRTNALKAAKQFVENGIEMGYIRMPDPSTLDAAHDTLPTIIDALAQPLPARAAAMVKVVEAAMETSRTYRGVEKASPTGEVNMVAAYTVDCIGGGQKELKAQAEACDALAKIDGVA